MLQNPILFHVMVPVYKVEAYLDECVQSVLDQTYQNFELILVDDGSPDRSGTMCDAWAETDPRIHVYHKPNGGVFHTRCYAVCQAGMEGYGVFLDSDDALEPHALETLANTISQYRCDCVVYGSAYYVDGTRGPQLNVLAEEPLLITDKRELYDAILKSHGGYDAVWRKAVRMDRLSHDLDRYQAYFHIRIAEDRLHSLEMYQNCQSICFIPDVLHKYRMNPEGVMQSTGFEKYCADFTVYEYERDVLSRDPAYAGAPFEAYRKVRIFHLTETLMQIARLQIPQKERRALYETIRTSSYWRDFLSGGNYELPAKKAIVYEAFRRGWDSILLWIASIRR